MLKKFLFYNEYFYYISNDFNKVFSIVFDHLIAPIAFYFTKDEVEAWFKNAELHNVKIYHHNKNSWKAFAHKQTK